MSIPRLYMRVGDQLPSIACQILDESGAVVALPRGTDAHVLIRPTWSTEPTFAFSAVVDNDTVGYDWSAEDAALLEVGAYDLAVRCDLPDGTHIIAPTDHHCELAVGSWMLPPGHWLDPNVGYASTTDPGRPPAQFTLVAKIAGPIGTAVGTLAGQWAPAPNHSWHWAMNADTRRLRMTLSTDGTIDNNRVLTLWPRIPETAGPYEIALAFDYAPIERTWTHVWYRLSGQNWVQGDRETHDPIQPLASINDLLIGVLGPATNVFDGLVWYVEMREGIDPREGEILWRFSADEGFTHTTWTDPRGTTWTLSDPEAIE